MQPLQGRNVGGNDEELDLTHTDPEPADASPTIFERVHTEHVDIWGPELEEADVIALDGQDRVDEEDPITVSWSFSDEEIEALKTMAARRGMSLDKTLGAAIEHMGTVEHFLLRGDRLFVQSTDGSVDELVTCY